MNWVLLILTLVCSTPSSGIEECHPNNAATSYFQDADLCNAARDRWLKLQPRELILDCERITRPIGDDGRGKK